MEHLITGIFILGNCQRWCVVHFTVVHRQAPQDFAQAAGEAAAAAEEATMANIGVGGLLGAGGEAAGALEGAEAGGIFGGIPGALMGAGIGGAAAETATSLMFRNREAPQAQSSFLDARTLNNQSQRVRPIQPRITRLEGFE